MTTICVSIAVDKKEILANKVELVVPEGSNPVKEAKLLRKDYAGMEGLNPEELMFAIYKTTQSVFPVMYSKNWRG